MTKSTWPNFFIVGAPRAGTTSLYEYLKQVPEIYMSPVKEPYYFTNTDRRRSEAEYLDLFRGGTNKKAIGEASVGYLRHPEAPERIKRAVPDARIIIVLRDPVEQVYSHYFEFVRKHASDLAFEEAVHMGEHTKDGFYADSVQRYLDVFGARQVKIILFEEFVKNPRKTVEGVMGFLGIAGASPDFEPRVYNSFTAPRAASTSGILNNNRLRRLWRALLPRVLRRKVSRRVLYRPAEKPPLPPEARSFLEQMFRPDVERLEAILGRQIPWYHRRRLAEDDAVAHKNSIKV